jgi:hypothetical protein
VLCDASMRALPLVLLLAAAGGGDDAKRCSLDTVPADCATSCGSQGCKSDPICDSATGHWRFDCAPDLGVPRDMPEMPDMIMPHDLTAD